MNKKCKLHVYGDSHLYWGSLNGERFRVYLLPRRGSGWKTKAGVLKHAERVAEELGLTITKVEMPEE